MTWTAQRTLPAPEDVADPRSVGGPELVADMFTVTDLPSTCEPKLPLLT